MALLRGWTAASARMTAGQTAEPVGDISLEHWDRTKAEFQEQVIGRHKLSGAPLGKTGQFEPLGLDRVDGSGLFACPPGVAPGGYLGQGLFI